MTDHNPLPGTGSIADSVEFVKKLWGIPSAGALPGMLIPTLSLDEINKKIADLKAVESWMAVNMNMLRGTIQALEVQSATIVNLQSMGAVMGVSQGDPKAAQAQSTAGFPFAFPGWPPAAQETKSEARPEPVAAAAAPESTFASAPAPEPASKSSAASGEDPASSKLAPAGMAPNANAWWDLLQNQFKQAVSTALMPDALTPPKPAAKAKPTAAKPPASKVSARKAPLKAKPKSPAPRSH
ncbi:MAG TPA: PhaM family polyhydroxyalkanoate granule multifunctional regulatory protein [Herbaspirillum sp.]|jgi:hypothetical protein